MAEPKGGVEGKSVGEGSAAPPDEFRRFLVALAVDPAKLGAFLKDPDEVMKAAGISDVDRIILKSGYPAAIHARLSGQKLAFTPAVAIPALVVDLVRPPEGAEGEAQPVVRTSGQWAQPAPWSVAMYPNIPLPIFPQVQPQIFPQVHPQLVIHPQIYPQIHPIFPVHPQIYPQIHPIFPVHPQLVIHPQIYPQIHPIYPQIHPIFPQVHPQLVIHPQIYPQIHPIFPQVHPLVYPQVSPYGG